MKKPLYMEWLDEPYISPSFPFKIAIEKEAEFRDVYKASDWKKKLLMHLVKLFGYTPQLAFQKEDVDMLIVEKMLKHIDLLRIVDKWISETDYTLLKQLQEAKKVFETIQKPSSHQYLYRGFTMNRGQQNSGLDAYYKKLEIGNKWNYTPDKPMSFSWHKGTTGVYGNIIVSADYAKVSKRCLHITHEMVFALFNMDDDYHLDDNDYMFTYAESVLLPDGKPIELTLVNKG